MAERFLIIASDLRAGVEKGGFRTQELLGVDSPLEGRPTPEGRPWFDSGMPAQDEAPRVSW
jgi:hypothetical protein